MVGELRPAAVARDVHSGLGQLRAQLGLVARPDAVRVERLDEPHLLPLREVDVVAAEGRLRPADRRLGRAAHELLQPRGRVLVVRVRLVPLDLGELRRVLVRVALVAEVLRELVDLLEPADDEPLEVELVGDAEVELGVEQLGARDERLGEAAAVARLQDRRLDLEEALAVEVARGSPRPCARA